MPAAPADLPFELPGLLNRSLGIGLPVLLAQGLGNGLAVRVAPAELEVATSSSPSSLKPDMSLLCRGRSVEADAGVELVRPLLLAPLCIAGSPHTQCNTKEPAGWIVVASLTGSNNKARKGKCRLVTFR